MSSKPGQTVILEEGHELRDDALLDIPNAARRAIAAAQSMGWRTRCIRTVAAVPDKGIITAITVRCARLDERVWVSWWNGSFDSAQYCRAGQQIERLGAEALKAVPTGRVSLDRLTVDTLREMCKARGIKVGASPRKADIMAKLVQAGVATGEMPPGRRSFLDAIEGRRV